MDFLDVPLCNSIFPEEIMIDKQTLDHVCELARLRLSADNYDKMQNSLSDILSYMDTLNECNTEDVEITYNVLNSENRFREDVVKSSFKRDDILKNAPSSEAGCFTVPHML